ncbi:polyprenyl synthetase family protein [Nonomuraea sp. NPDC050556]|uniref:polyprenyl synthetase family protein n=1 Tax=Nonomuraea sp. NPDC050556 TaxID=3364369 RepID=UPI00379F1D6E
MDQLLNFPAVADGLRKVENRIRRLSGSSTLPGINQGAEHVITAGGKRLRPALTLATALALGKTPDRRVITAAACVELIHAGSLVHDDLMEDAKTRRGTTTLNADLGTGKALVIGDFMLARAGLAAITSVSRPVAEVLAATMVELAEGQYLETVDLFNRHRTQENALRSITGKTASLFRAGCLVAAICAHASPEERARMATYGERFGLIFQILDDLMDLTGDVREGVYTLPLLRALEKDPGLLDGDVAANLARSTIVPDTLAYCRELAAESLCTDPLLANLPSTYINKVEKALSTCVDAR